MKNSTTLAILGLVSALGIACGGPTDASSKREKRVENGSSSKPSPAASKKIVSSSESQPSARGARDSSGGDDVVVNVRNRSTTPGDLALVASCGDRNYPQAQDASSKPECDVASGAHETRSQP